ncbi:hypothetical protein PG997_011736 [Apiospora hydei]|uniref:DUF7918 domain-containing protein n=1 Tax=Apiospora hydei TaxID=1337664 RepID=A0ABR1V1B9_9PEZI
MAVLDEIPGIGVVVRVGGLIVEEYHVPAGSQELVRTICPFTYTYIVSSDDTEFSVGIAVDELYDFSRSEDHRLHFSVTVDGDRLAASCGITRENVRAGYGRARDSVVRATSFDARRGYSRRQPAKPLCEGRNREWRKGLGNHRVRVYRVVRRKPVGIRSGPSLFDCFNVAEMARTGNDTTELERAEPPINVQNAGNGIWFERTWDPLESTDFCTAREDTFIIPPSPPLPPLPAIRGGQNVIVPPGRERHQRQQQQATVARNVGQEHEAPRTIVKRELSEMGVWFMTAPGPVDLERGRGVM